jgi:NitT/TauT family transport system substrate-binding protein
MIPPLFRSYALLALYLGILFPLVSHAMPIRIAMSKTPLAAPFIVAQQHGFFARQGISVDIIDINGGHRAAQMLLNGQADIATSSDSVVMFNSFQRQDFVVFATFVSSDNDIKILARRDSGIRTLADLVGHKVGTVLGASPHFFLHHSLLLADIDPAQVELLALQPEFSIDALDTKYVEAIVIWEPWAYQAQRRLGQEVLVLPHDKAYVETFNALTLRAYAQAYPEQLQGFVSALIHATEFMQQHSSQSKTMIAARLAQSRRQLDALWPDFKFSINLHQWLLNTLEAQARWAIEQKLVKADKVPNYLDFIWLPALEAVKPTAISIFR